MDDLVVDAVDRGEKLRNVALRSHDQINAHPNTVQLASNLSAQFAQFGCALVGKKDGQVEIALGSSLSARPGAEDEDARGVGDFNGRLHGQIDLLRRRTPALAEIFELLCG